MATYKEQLRRVWHLYDKEHGPVPATAREAVQWGIAQGMIEMASIDPLAKLAEDMATALREEFAVDDHGRRYRLNHAVRVTKGGVQYTFWAIMKDAPREHMHKRPSSSVASKSLTTASNLPQTLQSITT